MCVLIELVAEQILSTSDIAWKLVALTPLAMLCTLTISYIILSK